MKLTHIRNVFALSFTVLLAACGAGNPADLPAQTNAMVQTNVAAATGAAQAPASTAGASTGAATAVMVSANMPQPDCAADGCKGLRIIDGNAEAFRYAAMQRAGEAPQS